MASRETDHQHLDGPKAWNCPYCPRTFDYHKVTIDNRIASNFYTRVASLIARGKVRLSKSTANRIGGSANGSSRYRRTLTSYGIEYCRAVFVYCGDPTCVIINSEEASSLEETHKPPALLIVGPQSGSTVDSIDMIFGEVSNNERESTEGENVWVFVRPEGYSCWVQRPSRVLDGRWQVRAHFGDRTTEDGYRFSICAVIGPDKKLRVGQTLRSAPHANYQSAWIEVTLKRSDQERD